MIISYYLNFTKMMVEAESINGQWTRLSILWRIMEIEAETLRDLHNSSYGTKPEFNNCFIIHSK